MIVYVAVWGIVLAQNKIEVPDFNTSPEEFLDNMAQGIDKGSDRITQSHLDTIHHNEGDFEDQYQITNTLDALRKRLVPYIQRAVYLGLAGAVIALVVLGFQLVRASLSGEDKLFSELKSNMITISVGVLGLTGLYFIIKLMLSVIENFTT